MSKQGGGMERGRKEEKGERERERKTNTYGMPLGLIAFQSLAPILQKA